MPRCEISVGCWFYRRGIDVKSTDVELLQKYCHGDYMGCDRYQLAQYLGIRYLPRGLQPNDMRQIKGTTRAVTG